MKISNEKKKINLRMHIQRSPYTSEELGGSTEAQLA